MSIIKSIIVRLASWSLYNFLVYRLEMLVTVLDCFQDNLLNKVKLESRLGFAYSLELLVKCERLGLKIDEIPAKWEERTEGKSNFKIFKWLTQYLKWYYYGLETYWLNKKFPINLNKD